MHDLATAIVLNLLNNCFESISPLHWVSHFRARLQCFNGSLLPKAVIWVKIPKCRMYIAIFSIMRWKILKKLWYMPLVLELQRQQRLWALLSCSQRNLPSPYYLRFEFQFFHCCGTANFSAFSFFWSLKSKCIRNWILKIMPKLILKVWRL